MIDKSSQTPWSPPSPFPIAAPLTGAPLDRAAELRGASKKRDALLQAPEARVLAMWRGKPPIRLDEQGAALAWAPVSPELLEAAREAPILLGRSDEGAGRFAVDLSTLEEPEALGFWPEPPKFIDLRSISVDLPPEQPPIVAEAKALVEWHAGHPCCARCGATTRLSMGGWRRDCDNCGAKHFPRTDPVAIMLATRVGEDGVERVILGRQHGWPGQMHSLLAGYVEPGETVEEAACRETREEAGVKTGRAAYLTGQPWPFPTTLMMGVWVEVLSDRLQPDLDELETCRWADKDEVRAALEGRSDQLEAPRVDAIARTLLQAWVDGAVRIPRDEL